MCIVSIFNWYSCRWQSKLFSLKKHPCILDTFCYLPSFLGSTRVHAKWELKYEGLSFFGFSVVFCSIRIETWDDYWSGIFRREALALSGSCTELPFEHFPAPLVGCWVILLFCASGVTVSWYIFWVHSTFVKFRVRVWPLWDTSFFREDLGLGLGFTTGKNLSASCLFSGWPWEALVRKWRSGTGNGRKPMKGTFQSQLALGGQLEFMPAGVLWEIV